MKKTRIAQHISALTARETDWIPNEHPTPKPWDGKFTDVSHTDDDSVDIPGVMEDVKRKLFDVEWTQEQLDMEAHYRARYLELLWGFRSRHDVCVKGESGHDV